MPLAKRFAYTILKSTNHAKMLQKMEALRFFLLVAAIAGVFVRTTSFQSPRSPVTAIIPLCHAFSVPPRHRNRYSSHRNHHHYQQPHPPYRSSHNPKDKWNGFYISTQPSSTRLAMAVPKVGLIGLPNVGKSTLFNAVAQTADLARAANFPFCTIEANRAPIAVPDAYLERLSSQLVVPPTGGTLRPARIELVDVAGLVKGASRGEGLGNQFLATIRECQVIVHVLRYFDDANVIRHEEESSSSSMVDPVFDAAIVNHELLLADLAHAEKRLTRIQKQLEREANNPALALEAKGLTKALEALREDTPARFAGLTKAEVFAVKSMGLLTLKPVVYAFNVDETDFTAQRAKVETNIRTKIMPQIRSNDRGNFDAHLERDSKDNSIDTEDDFVLVSARLEEDLLSLGGPEEQSDYMSELMSVGGNDDGDGDGDGDDHAVEAPQYQNLLSYKVLPTRVCKLLSLSLCYTGPGVPKERSQTTKSYLFDSSSQDETPEEEEGRTESALTAFGLAGKIHGELQRGFLHAEVIAANDLLRFETFRQAKEDGCVRTEGKDYVIQEGDTVLIKWRE